MTEARDDFRCKISSSFFFFIPTWKKTNPAWIFFAFPIYIYIYILHPLGRGLFVTGLSILSDRLPKYSWGPFFERFLGFVTELMRPDFGPHFFLNPPPPFFFHSSSRDEQQFLLAGISSVISVTPRPIEKKLIFINFVEKRKQLRENRPVLQKKNPFSLSFFPRVCTASINFCVFKDL